MKSLTAISLLALALASSDAEAATYNPSGYGGTFTTAEHGAFSGSLTFTVFADISSSQQNLLNAGISTSFIVPPYTGTTPVVGPFDRSGGAISIDFYVYTYVNNNFTVNQHYQTYASKIEDQYGNRSYNIGSGISFNIGTDVTGILWHSSTTCYNWCGAWPEPVMTINASDVIATPLPAALPLFAAGLGLLGWFSRKKPKATLQA
jgi:hypothetical protein